MADISTLGELKPVEPLDLENYADNKEFTGIPKAGRYTVKAPSSFPSTAFGRTKAGSLSVAVDPEIIGPTNEGFTVRFTKVSAKPFKRGGLTVSQLGDYLRATGFRGKLADEQAQADAVEQTANQVYEVDLDWRAYNTKTGFSLEGMERFPSDGNGGHLPWTTDPNAFQTDEHGIQLKGDDGNPIPVRVRANLIVTRYVPQA